MGFQAPQLGALGVTFTGLRAMQFVSLITIIGLVSNFVNEIVTAQREAPAVLIGTLVVASTATLYIAINYILYYDGLLPLLISAGLDSALMIAVIVVAVTLGKPLSMLNCPPITGTNSLTIGSSTFVVSSRGVEYRDVISKIVSLYTYATIDKPHCYETKTVWGLSIALCVLFAFSAVVSVCLWRRVKSSAASFKDVEGSG